MGHNVKHKAQRLVGWKLGLAVMFGQDGTIGLAGSRLRVQLAGVGWPKGGS